MSDVPILTKRRSLRFTVLGFCSLLTCAIADGTPAQSTDVNERRMLSLIEVSPELHFTAKRYSKFYGDSNTVNGSLLERSSLLGDAGGVRDTLVNNGIFIDAGVTQFVAGNLSGGERTSATPRYSGSVDLWAWLDSGKAGLWPGGAAFLHAEGRWNRRINGDVGSLLPSNFDTTMPDGDPGDSNWAFSEWYLMQALPGKFLAAAGKMDAAAWADTNMFANSERSQFFYTGFINNAVAGTFFPYTQLAAWLSWAPSKAHTLIGGYAAADDDATQAGFDEVFNGDDVFFSQYIFSTDIADRPGRYIVAGIYSTKDVTGFDVSRRFSLRRRDPLEDIIVSVPTLKEKSNNRAVIANFSQYLWVKEGSSEAFNRRAEANPHHGLTHHRVPPPGIGVFGRAGWAPDDRNTIDQFYSLGIGGYGMLIPGRDNDQWGIGWAGSHISSDLRDLGANLRTWEHAGEVFYNFSLTPAVHFTVNSQVIRPADETVDTAFVVGARLQMDF